MAGILDSLFGDLQGTSAGGLLGLLGGGNIGTATRRLRTPEEEALAGYTPTDYTPAPPPPASLKGDYLGGTPAPPPLGPPINVPSLQVAGAPNGPYAQYSPTSAPAAPLPQQGAAGLGGDQNPLMGLLGGIGNLFGPSAAQAAPAPGTAQQPNLPAPAAAGPAAGPGLFGRLQAGATNLSSGGNPLAGLINAVGGLATGERTDRQSIALQNQANTANALYGALIKSGRYSPEEAKGIAIAASTNPGLATAILPQAFGSKYEGKVVKDLAGEHIEAFDPITGTTKSTAGGGGGDTGVGGPTVLAPGVKKYDPYLGPEEYMAQFSPDMQSAMKMQIRGDTMPSGNPRLQGLWPTAKGFASLYADKAGIPFNDAVFAEKRRMRTQLADSSNSSMGGILSNGDSALGHLADASEDAAKLKNVDIDFPGGGYLAHGINRAYNQGGGSSRFAQVGAVRQNLGRYGQESTKVYAASGGGQEERMAAVKDHNPDAESSAEMAAFYQKEKNLLMTRINGKLAEIRQALGPEDGDREIAKKNAEHQCVPR